VVLLGCPCAILTTLPAQCLHPKPVLYADVILMSTTCYAVQCAARFVAGGRIAAVVCVSQISEGARFCVGRCHWRMDFCCGLCCEGCCFCCKQIGDWATRC
jgi:hypothetical protein